MRLVGSKYGKACEMVCGMYLEQADARDVLCIDDINRDIYWSTV